MINIVHQSRLKVLQKFYYFIFQTDECITLNRRLIQNDVKFQCSVFIFLNRGFHAFVLTKFPLSLLNLLSCPYLTTAILISMIPSLFYVNTYLSCGEFWGVTSRNVRGIPLCVQLLQRMISYLWCFLVGAPLIY